MLKKGKIDDDFKNRICSKDYDRHIWNDSYIINFEIEGYIIKDVSAYNLMHCNLEMYKHMHDCSFKSSFVRKHRSLLCI